MRVSTLTNESYSHVNRLKKPSHAADIANDLAEQRAKAEKHMKHNVGKIKVPKKYQHQVDQIKNKMNETIKKTNKDVNNYIETVISKKSELSKADKKLQNIEYLINDLLAVFTEFMSELSMVYDIYTSDEKTLFRTNLATVIGELQLNNNQTVHDMISKFIGALNTLDSLLSTINVSNTASITTLRTIKSTIKNYASQIDKITQNLDTQIDVLKSSAVTNARRSDYEYRNIEYLDYIKWCLFVVYIILVLLYCAFGPFVRNEEYNTYIGWAKTLALITSAFIPFYIAWFIEIVYSFIVKMVDSVIDTRVYSINQNDSPLKLKNTMSQNVLGVPIVISPYNH